MVFVCFPKKQTLETLRWGFKCKQLILERVPGKTTVKFGAKTGKGVLTSTLLCGHLDLKPSGGFWESVWGCPTRRAKALWLPYTIPISPWVRVAGTGVRKLIPMYIWSAEGTFSGRQTLRPKEDFRQQKSCRGLEWEGVGRHAGVLQQVRQVNSLCECLSSKTNLCCGTRPT